MDFAELYHFLFETIEDRGEKDTDTEFFDEE